MPASLAEKIGLGPSELSLSTIVMVCVAGDPSVAPDGLLNTTLKVSFPSAYESLIIGTATVFDVSPAAKVNVPAVVVKSQRPKAVPCLVPQPTVRVSASVVR